MTGRLRLLIAAASVPAVLLQASTVSAQATGGTAVGFRVVRPARTSATVAVWYPAERTARGEPMTVEQYLTTTIPSERLAQARAGFLVGVARNYGGARGVPNGPRVPDLPDSVATATMAHHTTAVLDAKPLGGRRPLVVLTMALGSTGAADVAPLAEVFASRGYAVAVGEPLVMPPGTSIEDYLRLIKVSAEQVYDITVALPDIDPSKVFALDPTVATALLMEAERKRWRGVIAMDEMPFPPSIRSALTAAAGSISTPLLYIPLDDPAPNGDVVRNLTRVGRTDVVIPGARHGLLSAWGTYFRRQLGLETANYDSAVRAMLEFLDRVSKRPE